MMSVPVILSASRRGSLLSRRIIPQLARLSAISSYHHRMITHGSRCCTTEIQVPEVGDCYNCIQQIIRREFTTTCTRHFAKQIVQDVDEESMGKGDKILKVKIATTRLDTVIKAGLGISKSKIEKAFYDDKIRLNGQRPKKKSQLLDEKDEVDIVRGINILNPLFLDVSRVEIIEIVDDSSRGDAEDDSEDEGSNMSKIPVILKRYKNLTIQNYSVPWKGNVSDLKS